MKKLSEKQRMVNRDPFQPSKELRVAFGWLSKLSPSTHLLLSTFLQNKYEVSFFFSCINTATFQLQSSDLSPFKHHAVLFQSFLSAECSAGLWHFRTICAVPYLKQRVGNVAFWGDKHVWDCSVKCVIIYYVLIEIETGSPFTNRVWGNQGTENIPSFRHNLTPIIPNICWYRVKSDTYNNLNDRAGQWRGKIILKVILKPIFNVI